jgi:hypothetical protein
MGAAICTHCSMETIILCLLQAEAIKRLKDEDDDDDTDGPELLSDDDEKALLAELQELAEQITLATA